MKKLWVEAYRPSHIKDVVFSNDAEKALFENIVASGELPNLLLVGHQGTGKTSISLALVNDLKVDSTDVLRINCSDEQIDAIRAKVKSFAYTMPMGKFKVVRLEEMDYLSMPAQALLRSLIEEVSASCRFIGTANYENRLLPAIHSRFQMHRISKPALEQAMLRVADIMVAENVEFEVDDLEKVFSAAFPDLRKVIQIVEANSKTGKLLLNTVEAGASDWKLQLLPLLESNDLKGARTLVCAQQKEELQDVYRFLYENVHRIKGIRIGKKEDEAIILIAQYQYQHAFVADVEIQIAALFIELGAL